MRHALRALPTLFRIGLSEMVAYRAEFLVWILTTNMPLVMMALWTAVAADGPVGRFGQKEFVTYYLATLIVRILTSTWMVWELTMDIRQGRLSGRLLRPLHPLLAYAAQHLAAVPLRALVVSPLIAVLLVASGAGLPVGDPSRMAIFAASLAGAWLLLFVTMVLIGTLAFYMESALSLFDIWLGVHFILSGYLVPIELLPSWVGAIGRYLPFRYCLAFPVETLMGLHTVPAALHDLGVQAAFIAGMSAAAMLAWRAGVRRFAAFGG